MVGVFSTYVMDELALQVLNGLHQQQVVEHKHVRVVDAIDDALVASSLDLEAVSLVYVLRSSVIILSDSTESPVWARASKSSR